MKKILEYTIISILAGLIPLGIGLAIYHDNPSYLWMSLLSLIVFMAG